ncbi:dual specificity calcium/calmodulin-dependent 3',5'-cyclic nucleotide phosphodiesterase 1-like [Anopheles ziemanni]|uniref:dual specificity calcium/calmodulin-dependent 3',5'-cyclic nucleotide phosphodiesterase 1-like n=1 Tax=Anopheles coustani TaxID=139045 RepID=UPI00265801C4|nr:dual specificity calcium/calmodulin-dependent 3',5'-cyclic nucleotide phosphodiesterase 1-like [Anopheles coustani]XP_058177181.1 dual specificity calcium/calmodulin-dependent 3',5'-cyclic nucleotide phosphodiesterase 1-like [Anopheles ziemanni]
MANQANQSLKSNNPSSVPPPSAPSALLRGDGVRAAIAVSPASTIRTSLIDRPVAPSRPISLPMPTVAPHSPAVAMPSRTSRSATRSSVASNPFVSQSAGMRVFKKCKSATFQIDGHTYTIVASSPENKFTKDDITLAGAGPGREPLPCCDPATCPGPTTSYGSCGPAATTQVPPASAVPTVNPATGSQQQQHHHQQQQQPQSAGSSSCHPYHQHFHHHHHHHHCHQPVRADCLSRNGHIAKQGSLTIVRRTNSRKNTNIQQQLQYQEALDESDYQQPAFGSDSGAEGSAGGGAGGGGGGFGGAAGDSGGGGPEGEFGQQHPPLSESELAFVNSQLSRELESMQPTAGAAIVAANRTDSTTGDELDTVDLATDNLPAVDTPDACDKAAVRLRCLLRQLQRGEISAELLQKNLHYAARVLEAVFIDETNQDGGAGGGGGNAGGGGHRANAGSGSDGGGGGGSDGGGSSSTAAHGSSNAAGKETHRGATTSAPPTHGGPTGPPASKSVIQRRRLRAPVWARSMRLADEDDELSEVQPDAVPPEVREWLASTFTRQLATTRKKSDEKPKFRSVAHAIRAGIFVDRIYRRVSSTALMQFPPEVVRVLKTLDDWSFDVFALAEAGNCMPVKYLGYDLLNRYGMIHKFKVPPATLETFLTRIEEGYCRFRNPYHNNLHAADVAQTVHHVLCQTGLMHWLTDLEIFATLLAALIHDYEHTGTTNNFHVMSGSDTAMLYNDRAVLENHHISAAFRVLKEDDCNVLQNLSRDEFRELRTLIIDMVLATDMSFHFQQLKNMRNLLTLAEPQVDKSKALSLVLHCCDISHPAKRWDIHHKWTMLLLEEFFRQGDLERELGLPFSPLCDRNNTLVAESQIGFIEFIVEPSMTVCADMLEIVLAPIAPIACNASSGAPAPTSTAPNNNSSSSNSNNNNNNNNNSNNNINCNTNVNNNSSSIKSTTNNTLSVPSNNTNNNEAISSGSGSEEKGGPGDGPEPAAPGSAGSAKNGGDPNEKPNRFKIRKPWITCLAENKKIWKEQAVRDAEARAAAAAAEAEAAAAAAAALEAAESSEGQPAADDGTDEGKGEETETN